MASATGSSAIVRVRGGSFLQRAVVLPALFLVGAGLYIVIDVISIRHAHYVVYGVTLGGLAIAVGLAAAVSAIGTLRGVVANQTEVRIATGWRWRRIPLADVSGVGLLFQYSPGTGRRALPGWYLTLWSERDGRCQIPQLLVSAHNWIPPATPHSEWHLPFEDSAALARTKPGLVALKLVQLIDRVQGPDGLLVTRHDEKHVVSDRFAIPQSVAWWSPDGAMGRIN
jgi:hypothetical protein